MTTLAFKTIGALLVLASTAATQTATITGTICDAFTGAPLPGCNLIIAGSNHGTASHQSGYFELTGVTPGEVTLVASFIGYKTIEIRLNVDRLDIRRDICLTPDVLSSPGVTVVATRARERQSPVAYSTLEQAEIDERYFVQDIPVMLSELPSTTSYSESGNGVGYNYISIRGFDQRRISVLINGVPQNDPEDHNVYWLDFPDFLSNVEDVQVQRGAGMAFYGPAAIGGSINILTSRFSSKPGISAYAGGGSYNTSKFSFAANSGLLFDKFIVFGRLSRIQSDGYRERSWVDFKSYFLGVAHVTDKTTTRLHFYGGPLEDHLAYYGISKENARHRDTRRENPIARPDEIENFNQPHVEVINEWRINDRVRVNNTLFGVRGYGFFDYDGSWAPMSYFRLTPEYGFAVDGDPEQAYVDSLLIRAYVDNQQAGWLPQITYTHSLGEVTVGGEFRFHRSLHWGRIQEGDSDLPRAVTGEYRGLNYVGSRRYYEYKGAKEIISPYVHTTYRLRPLLMLTFDLQYIYSEYRLYDEEFLNTDFKVPYNFWNPRLGLNYNLSPSLNLFGSVARTTREPRLKNLYDAAEASTPTSWGAVVPQFEIDENGGYDFSQPLIKPETLYDLELGFGYRRGGLSGHLNLYYMDFKDEIIKQGQLDRFGQPITGNAERTLHQGIELGIKAQFAPPLTISGNLAVSKNELKQYVVFDEGGNSQNLRGNPIAGFPDRLGNLRLEYTNSGLLASLALQYVGKQYTDNFKNEVNTVDAYTVFNVNFEYAFAQQTKLAGLTLQLHVRNLFDTLYLTHGESDQFFPAAERQVFLNGRYELGF